MCPHLVRQLGNYIVVSVKTELSVLRTFPLIGELPRDVLLRKAQIVHYFKYVAVRAANHARIASCSLATRASFTIMPPGHLEEPKGFGVGKAVRGAEA